MTVELLYDKDCPNVDAARANLGRALAMIGLPARWTEWETSSPSTPARLHGYGSPTVLVDGQDVEGTGPPGHAASCRIYNVAGRRSGVPAAELIARALVRAKEQARTRGWRRAILLAPAVGVAFLPTLTCPACWPAYAALLSALGLGFIPTAPYLLPLTAFLLLVAVAGLAVRADRRMPFVIALVAAPLILLGKFVFHSNPITYTGAALLVAASFPSPWRRSAAPCSACPPASSPGT
jgi:hypothetical protein